MIQISLETITNNTIANNTITDNEHAELRKQYLQEANKFYKKEAWNFEVVRHQAYIGMGLGVAGITGAHLLGYINAPPTAVLISTIFGLAGALNAGWAALRKRKFRKNAMQKLEYVAASISFEELKEKIKNKDYQLPEPTEEELKKAAMDAYASLVVAAVNRKEHGLIKHPWTIGGFCVMASGWYTSVTSSPFGGGLAMAFGGMMVLGSQCSKKRKLQKLEKEITPFIYEKGYDFLRIHARTKDPYDFYKAHIKKE